MTDRPYKPFNDAVKNIKPQQKNKEPNIDKIRDKDNADYRHPPPRFTPFGERNRAPKGMSGIKRDLLNPKVKEPGTRTAGALTKEFKPIVSKSNGKDRGFDR